MTSVDINSLDSLEKHKGLIRRNLFLKKLYTDFYDEFKRVKKPSGTLVELGSGGGFIKQIVPSVVTSDVVGGDGIDKVFNATKMPFKSGSVSSFFMLNVFHHIKRPALALKEISRCLKTGGKVVMIEPYNSVWARFIYQNFHHEEFDPGSGWAIKGKGRMSDANGAMPWIVFERDKKKFAQKFPELEITRVEPHTPILYLVTGGLSKNQLLPYKFYPLLKRLERLVSRFNRYIGMFVTIELTKK